MTDLQGDDVIRVAEMFSEVARTLAAHGDAEATLDKIVHLAVESLEHCEHAGISRMQGRRVTSPAASGDLPRIVDRIQSEVEEGPCVDAIKEHDVFRTGDLAAEERWPEFSVRAHNETGIRSVLSIRLFIEEDTMGALNMYSTQQDAFADAGEVAMATVFAAHAAVALSASRREETLERKAQSRDLIGQAKGILMSQSHVTEDAAFDLLRRASQRLNLKLVDVAQQVVDSDIASPGSGPST